MPFHDPGAGAAAPRAGEFDAPAGRTQGQRVMRRAQRGNGRRRPARVARRGGGAGAGEGEDARAFSRSGRQRQAAGDGEIRPGGLHVPEDGGGGTGLQRLLHGPQQTRGLLQGDGHEALARQTQPFKAMAIEPAMFALMGLEAAPQQGAAFLGVAQAAERQGEREAHGGGLVTMALRGHVMEPPARQALGRQVPVDRWNGGEPGHAPAPRLRKMRPPLLQPEDMRPQGVDQGCDIIALTERGDAGASFPAPRTMLCRFHTHD